MAIEGTGDPREWCVDWEVDVDVTVSKTVKVARSEIIEAATAEEAVEKVKAEMFIEPADVDLSTQVDIDDFEVGNPEMDTFRLTGHVTSWSM